MNKSSKPLTNARTSVKRRSAGSFEGISLAAYKRLLPSALAAAQNAGFARAAQARELCEAGVPPHLAKVCEIWPEQQKKSLAALAQIRDAGGREIARKYSVFTTVRKELGEAVLESMFRVMPDGEIRLDCDSAGDLGSDHEECCRTIYALYALSIGSTGEIRSLLSRLLAASIGGKSRLPGRRRARTEARHSRPKERVRATRRAQAV